jgi:hypothetical protein
MRAGPLSPDTVQTMPRSWILMQVVILVCVVAAMVVAITKLV